MYVVSAAKNQFIKQKNWNTIAATKKNSFRGNYWLHISRLKHGISNRNHKKMYQNLHKWNLSRRIMTQNCCHFGKKLSLLITMECQSSDSFLCCSMTSLAFWPIRVQRLKFSTLPQFPLNKSLRYALKKKGFFRHLFSVTHHSTFCLQVYFALSKKRSYKIEILF